MTAARTWSWWELDSFRGPYDLVVVGGGIVGLSTALLTHRKQPSARILVLEQGLLPTGASTRNAGFACFGSVSELLHDINTYGWEPTLDLVSQRWQGLQLLRRTLGDEDIGFHQWGGYEIFRPEEKATLDACLDIMPELNQQLESILGVPQTFYQDNKRIGSFGLSGVNGLVASDLEGQVHSGMLMNHLWDMVSRSGIRILTGALVSGFEEGETIKVNLEGQGDFAARRVVLATNGFARNLFPHLDVQPARGQVLVTDPIPNLALKGVFHYNEGFYYFRNLGNRVLLGGGRHLDIAGETTTDMALTATIQDALERLLREVIVPGTTVGIASRWSGIMGMGSQKYYILEEVKPRVVCAVRMSGMGVALGMRIAQQAVDMLFE